MKCCVCKREIKGFGNNALPLMDGICCDKCNQDKVLPLRMFLSELMPNSILIVNANGTISIEDVGKELTLERMQSIVEGYIELYPTNNERFHFIVNEEGLLKRLPENELAKTMFGLDVVGNLIVCPVRLLK